MDEKKPVPASSEIQEDNKYELTPEKVRQIVITFIKERIGQELPQGAYYLIDAELSRTKLIYSLKDYKHYASVKDDNSVLRRFLLRFLIQLAMVLYRRWAGSG